MSTDTRPPIASPQITADIVIFTIHNNQLHVALVERDTEPFNGQLSLPGGFMWANETSEQTAQRIVHAKVNAKNIFMEQLYTFDGLERDPRGRIVSVAYVALVPYQTLADDLLKEHVKVVPVANAISLGFDHDDILKLAVKRLRNKLGYSTVAYSVLPDLFTLTQLQQAYEVILGHSLDKRNFRKKIQSLDIIEETDKKTIRAAHRPAVLHRFKNQYYTELDEPIF